MSPIMSGVVGMLVMLALLFCGVPVGFSMAIVGFFGAIYVSGTLAAANHIAAFVPYSIMANYTFAVLPLFLLMANVCFHAGLGSALFNLVYKWMGRLPGGLAISSIGACALFGAVSASAIATSLTMGLVSIPEMRKYKYSPKLATGCVAAGGVLGVLMPPSGILIIYGVLTEQSIGELFIAGIIPCLLLAFMFMIAVGIWLKINPTVAPAGPSTSIKEKMAAFGGSAEMLALILLIICGMILGWITPTEAGGIGAFGAIIFSLIRRRLNWQKFKQAVMETVPGSGMIYVLLIGASIFNVFFALTSIPQELANIVGSYALPPPIVMGLMIVIYLILGCFIDAAPMILLTIPCFYPLAVSLGYDPIWFGIIIVLVGGMGMITPPVGMSVYVIAGIVKDQPMGAIFRGIVPFLIAEVVFAILLIAFPQIALFLPGLMQ